MKAVGKLPTPGSLTGPDIPARVLGHVSGGDVDTRVYDRYAYLDEKRDAVEKLAARIDRILNPDATVVPLRRA